MRRVPVFTLLLWFAMALCSLSTASARQFTLTVKPGALLQSASLGLGSGRFMPYAGFDAVGLKVDVTTDEESNNTYPGASYRYWNRDKSTVKGSAFLLIPHVGVKYQMAQDRTVRPHVFLEYFRALAFVSASGSDEHWSRHWENDVLTSDDYERDELDAGDAKDVAKDILAFQGINLGAGAEYYFADEFSLGGEYGLRLIYTSAEYKQGDSNPSAPADEWTDSWKAEGSAALRISYAALSLNYHF